MSVAQRGGDRVLQWAKKVVRDLDRIIRRFFRLYDVYLDDYDEVRMTRRARKNGKSKKRKQNVRGNLFINMVWRYLGIWLTQENRCCQ